MSKKYNEYIEQHKANVYKAFKWLEKNLPDIFSNDVLNECEWRCLYKHDESKSDPEEYEAYDKYFYGGNKSYDVVSQFNYAWLHHIHNNPHHWQYWVLINDNPDEGEIILDMPDVYIIEMICDWMSFSIAKGDPNELFNWYNEHKKYMKLSDYTRMKIENILDKIEVKLLELADTALTLKSDENVEN